MVILIIFFENSPEKWFWPAVSGSSHKDAQKANNFNLKYSKRKYFSIKMININYNKRFWLKMLKI